VYRDGQIVADKKVLNSENSGRLPDEYSPTHTNYELDRIHKRIDDIFTNGILTLKTRQAVKSTAFFTDDGILELDTAVTAITVQLPSAKELIIYRIYAVKDAGGLAGTRNITVLAFPGGTIDGATSRTISTNYGSFLFYSDGSKILVLS